MSAAGGSDQGGGGGAQEDEQVHHSWGTPSPHYEDEYENLQYQYQYRTSFGGDPYMQWRQTTDGTRPPAKAPHTRPPLAIHPSPNSPKATSLPLKKRRYSV